MYKNIKQMSMGELFRFRDNLTLITQLEYKGLLGEKLYSQLDTLRNTVKNEINSR